MRDLSLHLLDIIQNSIRAGANLIYIELVTDENYLEVSVRDNGEGMNAELLSEVTDPFVTTRRTRKVGLGIPLIKEACENAGGGISINSETGKGTQIIMKMLISSIDRLPIGDIGSTFMSFAVSNPEIDFNLTMRSTKDDYRLNFSDIREYMDGIPLSDMNVASWIRENIEEGKNYIFGGILNEVTGTIR